LIDEVVAADPKTYTLGDVTGPLVIVRIPDRQALPDNISWEGDLPGSTLATNADIMERAERLVWKRPAGGKGQRRLVAVHPPRPFVNDYLQQRRGRYRAPPLRGFARVPGIDDNGDVHFITGYNAKTGLFHDRSPEFSVAHNISLDDARKKALALLLPFENYRFEDHVAGGAVVLSGNAVLLAAIFTALLRPFLSVAPMIVVRSPMPGTGKGLIVNGIAQLSFDTRPVIVTYGGNSEEFEKRLGAVLLQAPGALSIDNANGMHVEGDLLESIITEGRADVRPLGRSEIVKVRSRSFITLTGNNPIITGDMARRTLALDIQPRSADPERDLYPFNPVEVIRRSRQDLLRAAYTAMRGYRLAGMPSFGLPAVGSFDEWSRKVRDLVYWLTDYDVSDAFRRNKAEDPRRLEDGSLLAALHAHFGANNFKSADAITIHQRVVDHRRLGTYQPAPTPTEQALAEAIDEALAGRAVSAKVFGFWARRVKDAHIGGFILDVHHDATTNTNTCRVRRT
jgi:putative DNA primase/helicase